MSDDPDIFDELEEGSEQPDLGGGYADWWDVDGDDPDHIMGPAVEIHSEPENFVEAGDVPDPLYTVVATGRGDFETGQARCTKSHAQVVAGLEGVEVGDLVNLHFDGYEKTDNGNLQTNYKIGVIKRETWEESGQADEIQELIDSFTGQKGDNRRTKPYQPGESDSGSSGSSEPASGAGSDGEQTPADFLMEIVGMQNGDMPVVNAKQMMDVKGFDPDGLDDAVAEADSLEVDGDTVRVA